MILFQKCLGMVLNNRGHTDLKTENFKNMNIVKRNSDWLVPSTIDGLFDRFFNDSPENRAGTFNPRVDIAETEKAFELEVAVPGFSKKDFAVDLKDGLLTISGERKFENKDEGKNFYAIQTQFGTFKKTFQLPDSVIEDKIEASYKNGILALSIPKDETKKLTSKITVK